MTTEPELSDYEITRNALIAVGIPAVDIVAAAKGPWAGGAIVRVTPDTREQEAKYATLLRMPDGSWLTENPRGGGRTDVSGTDPVDLLAMHRRVATQFAD